MNENRGIASRLRGGVDGVDVQNVLVRAILEVSPNGILVVDQDSVITAHNQRFLEMWRFPHPADLTGSSDRPVLSSVVDQVKDGDRFVKRVLELYEDPSLDDHCEVELNDGRTLERHSTVLRGENGQYWGRVWFFEDITPRRLAENKLREQIEAKDRAHAELAAAQQRLVELSRETGMAEIATGVLHNVGNVLNSVNVSTSLVVSKVRESRLDKLVALIRILDQHSSDLPEFLAQDPKGQRVLPYLAKLGDHLQSERESLLKELDLLSTHVGHIKQIVAAQQRYAKVSGLVEDLRLPDLVGDALRILESGLIGHRIKVEQDYEDLPEIPAEKHKILQILLNLLRNAKQSIVERGGEGERVIQVCIRRLESRFRVVVSDTGVGLPSENLTRIFGHGFTTKADGHGFGLHSCALAAREMGGSLWAESEGLGRGATFILELPLKVTAVQDGTNL